MDEVTRSLARTWVRLALTYAACQETVGCTAANFNEYKARLEKEWGIEKMDDNRLLGLCPFLQDEGIKPDGEL